MQPEPQRINNLPKRKTMNNNHFNKKQWIFIIAISMIIIFFTNVAFGLLLMARNNQQIACTSEAKICPDGSSVARSGPKCEFTPCPTPKTNSLETCNNMNIKQAKIIAQNSDCSKLGTILDGQSCNANGTGFWWLNFKPNNPKSGCNPACVIDIINKKAEINWRCTGLILPTITPNVSPIVNKRCKIGGCSGEICQSIDSEPIASTCIYKPEYACYKTARCELQANEKCGWTQTNSLIYCLSNTK
jgi:eight-cysteine-cluster-containing protein